MKHYQRLQFFNLLSIIIAPFAGFSQFMIHRVVEDGGGTNFEQEQKEALEKIKSHVLTEIEKAMKGLISKEDLDKKFEDINEKVKGFNPENQKELSDGINSELKKINDVLEKQGEALKDIQTKDHPQAKGNAFVNTFLTAMEEKGLTEKHTEDGIETIRFKEDAIPSSGTVRLKAVIDMTTALMLLPGSDPGTNIGYLTDYGMNPVKLPISQDVHLAGDVFPIKSIANKYFGVIVYYTETDGTAVAAENAALGQSSFLIKTVEYPVHDVGALYNFSENNLDDVPGLLNEMAIRGRNNIMKELDALMLSTTVIPGTSTIAGLLGVGSFTAFDATTWAGTVQAANVVNVLKKMKLQARLTDYSINTFILHPSLIDEIEGLKDADNNYLKSLGIVFDNNGKLTAVAGCAVVENSNVPYTAGGTKKAIGVNAGGTSESGEVGVRRDAVIELGYNSDDFGKRMLTARIYARVAFGIKDVNTIIVSEDVDADVAELDNAA